MKRKNDRVRETVLALLSEHYGSDAAFERAAQLPPKTVSNWRRGRSASYMRMLPQLASLFGVRVGDLLSSEGEGDLAEARLVRLWRMTAGLPDEEREALAETLETTVRLYLVSRGEK